MGANPFNFFKEAEGLVALRKIHWISFLHSSNKKECFLFFVFYLFRLFVLFTCFVLFLGTFSKQLCCDVFHSKSAYQPFEMEPEVFPQHQARYCLTTSKVSNSAYHSLLCRANLKLHSTIAKMMPSLKGP
jgi:hypothetical protein